MGTVSEVTCVVTAAFYDRSGAASYHRAVNPLYLLIEASASIFFIGAAVAALRRGRLPFLELISAAAFGILLEEGDQLVFETYHYSADWFVTIDRAPVVIGLTWALIIAGAMRLTDALGVRRRYAPFVDAVLAISLDLAFDAIAIRMGLWTWRGIGPADGWFGVPAGNFYSWLIVTLAFSSLTRWLRDASARRRALEWLQLAVPLPAFGLLLAGIVPFAILHPIVDPRPGGGMLIFVIVLAAFLAVASRGVWGPDRMRPDGERLAILDLGLALGTRVAIHGFFITALVLIGAAWDLPVLLLAALVLLAAEWPLGRLVHARHTAAHAATRHALPEVGQAPAQSYR
jgi:carotenoid biosynthesis protein